MTRLVLPLLLLCLLPRLAPAQPDIAVPPDRIAETITLLHHADPEVVLQAIAVLRPLHVPEALSELTALLLAKDMRVRVAAAGAYGQYGDEAPIAPLLALMKDPEIVVRTAGLQALFPRVKFPPEATDPLLAALNDPEATVSTTAAFLLGRAGGERAVNALIVAAHDRQAGKRQVAVQSLTRIARQTRTPHILTALLNAAQDPEAGVRFQATDGLALYAGQGIVDPLLTLAGDADASVRMMALYALRQVDDSRVRDIALRALADPAPQVRVNALRLVVTQHLPGAADLLAKALKDDDPDVRRQAAFGLASLRNMRAFEPLLALLKNDAPDVHAPIVAALKELTGKDFGDDVAKWQAWWAESARN